MQGPCQGLNHTVVPGDTWESVAAAKQTTYAAIRALNPGVTDGGAQPQPGDSICLGVPLSLRCNRQISILAGQRHEPPLQDGMLCPIKCMHRTGVRFVLLCAGCPPGIMCGVNIDAALSELLNGSPPICQMVTDCLVSNNNLPLYEDWRKIYHIS